MLTVWSVGAARTRPGGAGYARACIDGSIVRWIARRYDAGMTTSKIAISLPEKQLARVQRAVRAGKADSVSGYIARVLAEQERRESLRDVMNDLIAQHGEPKKEDVQWAKRVLATRRRG